MTEGDQIIVREKSLQQDMFYKNTIIMHYTIKYPCFISEAHQTLANKLNSLYKTKAVMYERSNIMNLYQMAMVEYEYSVANNYPIRPFEAYTDFTVTYNQNDLVSIYFDQYEYAGGAHGLTVRYSDTWNFAKSKRMELGEFFPDCANYREYIIRSIDEQIQSKQGKEDFTYFENYQELVKENFRGNNFYLTEDGLVVYFQQYDIAPYSSGIVTFVIS